VNEGPSLQYVVSLEFLLSSNVEVGVVWHLFLLLLCRLLFRRLGLGLLIMVGEAWRGSG